MIEIIKRIFVIGIFSLLSFIPMSGAPLFMDVINVENVQTKAKEKMNDSILLSLLEKYEVKYPKIVIAQAKLETGNYTSNLCVNHYNLFGIKSNNKYAHYSSFEESVLAYKNKIQYKLRPNEDYYGFLKRIHYASNPNYISSVKSIVRKLSLPNE